MNKKKYRRTLSLLLALGSIAGTINTPVFAQSEAGEPSSLNSSAQLETPDTSEENTSSVPSDAASLSNTAELPQTPDQTENQSNTPEASAQESPLGNDLSAAAPVAINETEKTADSQPNADSALNQDSVQDSALSASSENKQDQSEQEKPENKTEKENVQQTQVELVLKPGQSASQTIHPEVPEEKETVEGNTTTKITHNRENGEITSWTKTVTTIHHDQSLPEGWKPSGNTKKTISYYENGAAVEEITRELLDANGKVIGTETIKTYDAPAESADSSTEITRTEISQEHNPAAPSTVTVTMSEVKKVDSKGKTLSEDHELTHTIGNASLQIKGEDGTSADLALTISSPKTNAHSVTIRIMMPDGSIQEAAVDLKDGQGQYTLQGISLPENGNSKFSITLSGEEIEAILHSGNSQDRTHSQASNHTGQWLDTFKSADNNSLGDAGNFSIFARNIHWNGDAEGNFAADHLYAGADFGFDVNKRLSGRDQNGKQYEATLSFSGNRNHDQVDYSFDGISYFNHYENDEIKLHNTDSYLIAGDGYEIEVIENGNSTDHWLIEKANPEKRIKVTNGKDALRAIYSAQGDNKINFDSEMEKLTRYSTGLKDYVQNSEDESLKQGVKDLQSILENQATRRPEEPWRNNIEIDCKDENVQKVLKDGTFYIDLNADSLATLLNQDPERGRLYIRNLDKDQRIVFNLTNLKEGENYSLQRFIDINNNPYSQWDPMAGRVMLNFGDFNGIINLVKSSVGSILAPKATVNVNETHVGNIIADTVNGTNSKDTNPGNAAGGEIHYAQSKWDNPSIKGTPDQTETRKPASLMADFEMLVSRPQPEDNPATDSFYSVIKKQYKPKGEQPKDDPAKPEQPGEDKPEKPGEDKPENPGEKPGETPEDPKDPGDKDDKEDPKKEDPSGKDENPNPEKPGTDKPGNEKPEPSKPGKENPSDPKSDPKKPQEPKPEQPKADKPQPEDSDLPEPKTAVMTDTDSSQKTVILKTVPTDSSVSLANPSGRKPAMNRKADTGSTPATAIATHSAGWMLTAFLSAVGAAFGIRSSRKNKDQN